MLRSSLRSTLLRTPAPGVGRAAFAAHAARRLSTEPLEYASSCFLPTSWLELALVGKREHNHDSTVYTFGLPDWRSLNLPVCACLLLRVPGADGKDDVVRPYTPISPTSQVGTFELLVKRYEAGVASQYLHGLAVGEKVGFKHIKFNIKAQYPFEGKGSITMLCAGTGITPMVQGLQKLVDTPGDERPITLLYGSKSADDILMKDELSELAARAGGRLKVVHVVGSTPDGPAPPGWADTPEYVAETGWVDKAKIAKYAFPPSDDTLVFVCGLPSMYDALCGPRTEKELADGTALKELGYSDSMVAKM